MTERDTNPPEQIGADDAAAAGDAPAPRRRTYRDRVLDRIHRYTPADRDALVAFRRVVYSPDSFLARPDYVHWLYELDNGLGDGPAAIWLYRVDGAVEGMFAGLHTDVRIDGDDVRAMWGTDLFVDPRHKLRGVGPVLVEEGTATVPLTVGIEVSDEASQAFTRAGWDELGEVPLYVRPLRLAEAASGDNFRKLPGWALRLADPVWRCVDRVAAALRRRRGVRLEPIEHFDQRADAIWRDHADSYRAIGRRDAATLEWRFTAFPLDDHYHSFWVYRQERLLGYVVLRLGRHGVHRAGYVVDFLCDPGDVATVMGAAVDHFRGTDAELIYCMHPGGGAVHRQFQRAAFLVHTTGFRLMALGRDLDADRRTVVTDQDNWHITYADSNTDYPREGTVYPSGD